MASSKHWTLFSTITILLFWGPLQGDVAYADGVPPVMLIDSSGGPSAQAASCGGNLLITGSVQFSDLACTEPVFPDDPGRTVVRQLQSCCGSPGQCPSPPNLPRFTPPPSSCTDHPLRRARVELRINGTTAFVTETDQNGEFTFCLNNNNPTQAVNLQAAVHLCAETTTPGDACAVGSVNPWSVTATTPSVNPYLMDSAVTGAVCTGAVRWDFFQRLDADYKGAAHIYDLFANEAFEYLRDEVQFVNDRRLRVLFPAPSTGF